MALINPDTLNLDEHVIQTNKVQKTHKGGRTMSWSILVAVGDHKGYVGAGIGKARAIPDAIRKGVEAAKKSIVHVPMVGSTIPHDVLHRQNAAEILLKPASPGTGLVAGGSVRALLELAGVKDVLAKSLGSSNKVNTAWATIEALKKLEARLRRRSSARQGDRRPRFEERCRRHPDRRERGCRARYRRRRARRGGCRAGCRRRRSRRC